MRILLDTNIIIYREDNSIISNNIQQLFKLAGKNKIQLVVHPLSIKDIENDTNETRKAITLSKLKSYHEIISPPTIDDKSEFRQIIPESKNQHDQIDDNLLFALYRNAVSFLITNDFGLIDKAVKLNISDRIFTIDEAIEYITEYYSDVEISTAPATLRKVPLYSINSNDPFFHTLKQDYKDSANAIGFEKWFKNKAESGVEGWVYKKSDNNIGALLILKKEDEAISHFRPVLPKNLRVKISTLMVQTNGYKIGETFIKIAIEYAIKIKANEIYLTHFIKQDDYLLPLIHKFGFKEYAEKYDHEKLFIKYLTPPEKIENFLNIYQQYYPSFYDGKKVKKFVVPIQQKYHNQLFKDCEYSEQLLFDCIELHPESNTILKAYLSHSKIKRISQGDVLLFYLSETEKSLTTIGVVDKVYVNQSNPDKIREIVGKRTVYSKKEIDQFAEKKTCVILFRWHFYLSHSLSYIELLKENILLGPPQSILEIDDEKYQIIKKKGGIDNGFTFD